MPRVRKQARATLQQKRSKETRHALVVAAERLWRERDFDEVGIEEISAEVGVSKGLFYFYFPSTSISRRRSSCSSVWSSPGSFRTRTRSRP